MIISHKHRFIFMHSRKCAGSTIEVMLNRYLGPRDIQIGAWPETLNCGGKVNLRAIADIIYSTCASAYYLNDTVKAFFKKDKLGLFHVFNNAIKERYRSRLGINPSCPPAFKVKSFDPNAWQNYFKFAFTRNPFDYEISDYFWRISRMHSPLSFKEFLKRKHSAQRPDPEAIVPYPVTNWPIYTIDDKVAVDFVGRFEDLDNELKRISGQIGLHFDINAVPRAKSMHRKKINPSEIYDRECVDLVFALHQKEIDLFAYAFPY